MSQCNRAQRAKLSRSQEDAAGVSQSGRTQSSLLSRLSFFQSARTDLRLPSHIDAGALRAVPAAEVLAGFGKHFRSNVAGTDADYNLSENVDEIDYFLSHDWTAKARVKVRAPGTRAKGRRRRSANGGDRRAYWTDLRPARFDP
eukprot:TRINITY_DN12870_c0_g1_i1.p1 TRINITY_DN12870_c0_g1~~TRINITY_DN12870_c0_g1_i1.p1  ORF type:complete len:144 (-),score=5.24 TRINITY_DN12870_c0_g1_i1:131-562(-)